MVDDPSEWARYKRSPGLVLGFHGCDKDTAEKVLAGKQPHLVPSANDYDWLGPGIYFWEADPWRAIAFARDAHERKFLTKGDIRHPYAIGAVIDLGLCCNLLEVAALSELKRAYEFLETASLLLGSAMPTNKGPERGQRFLDKAVIQAMHNLRGKRKSLKGYQSVRAAFLEGQDLYANAGFKAKNHIQIAVRDTDCILGYFRLPGLS